jgi:DNA (cytosine-5)-methyltransferase 1
MRELYEFFAGGGMARIGLGDGYVCTFANDICPTKGAAYRANFGDGHLKIIDVAKLTTADLPGHAKLVWASPPCQDISLAGKGAGLDGSRSGAFHPWWRLMRGLVAEGRAPRVIVIENVAALITSGKGTDFAAVTRLLAEAGYVFGALIIDAALFLPQSRERVFIVAVKAGASLPPELARDGPTSPFHTAALRKAVANLPPTTRACWRWWRLPFPPARNTTLLDLLDFEAPCDGEEATRRLIELMESLHSAKVEQARLGGERAVGAICRRMRGKEQRAEIRFDGLAQALRTPGGGSSIQQFLLIDRDGALRSRRPTPRECVRLMGLPEDYVLPASTTDAYHLTGDGVVVPVVAWLNENLLSRIGAETITGEAPETQTGATLDVSGPCARTEPHT